MSAGSDADSPPVDLVGAAEMGGGGVGAAGNGCEDARIGACGGGKSGRILWLAPLLGGFAQELQRHAAETLHGLS